MIGIGVIMAILAAVNHCHNVSPFIEVHPNGEFPLMKYHNNLRQRSLYEPDTFASRFLAGFQGTRANPWKPCEKCAAIIAFRPCHSRFCPCACANPHPSFAPDSREQCPSTPPSCFPVMVSQRRWAALADAVPLGPKCRQS